MTMITQTELRQRFIRVRRERKVTLRQVAEITGISASTLSRLETMPDTKLLPENIFALVNWLNINPDPLTGKCPKVETFAKIKHSLSQDDSLTPQGRETLINLMQSAYQHVCPHST